MDRIHQKKRRAIEESMISLNAVRNIYIPLAILCRWIAIAEAHATMWAGRIVGCQMVYCCNEIPFTFIWVCSNGTIRVSVGMSRIHAACIDDWIHLFGWNASSVVFIVYNVYSTDVNDDSDSNQPSDSSLLSWRQNVPSRAVVSRWIPGDPRIKEKRDSGTWLFGCA